MAFTVKELAKELKIPPEKIIAQLRDLYVDVDDENSVVDEKIAGLVKIKLGGPALAKEEEKKKKAAREEKEKAAAKKAAEKAKREKKRKEEAKRKAEEEKRKVEEEAKAKAEEEKAEKAEDKKRVKKRKEEKRGLEIVKKAEPAETEEPSPEETPPEEQKELPEKDEQDIPERSKKEGPTLEIVERVSKPRSRKGAKTVSGEKPQAIDKGEAEPSQRKIKEKISVEVPISVRELGPRINTKPNDILRYLLGKGAMVNINQQLEEDVAREVMAYFGYELEVPKTLESMEKELLGEEGESGDSDARTRAPIVTFMGHVDHGKTSLLDYIRESMVTKSEKGGITQHIGAYRVDTPRGSVTFLDTPGHEAFTEMRARGANITDVVVLVVAANDGIMPQTREAIDHARAASVPIVVAINKCDMPTADPEKVKGELQQIGLTPEDWGGETITVNVSAVTGEGVDGLVEMLMLESEMLELKANPDIRARGVVVEGRRTPGEGVVATLLVSNGTLRTGDIVLCGKYYGKIKAMMDHSGSRVEKAPPATPVEILGLQGVPLAGEEFFVVKDEKKARTLTQLKQSESRRKKMAAKQRVTLEDLHDRIAEGDMKELKLIIKADVQGSLGALKESLLKLSTSEVKVNIIHEGIGDVNESDVMLAVVSDALILGFHVKTGGKAEELAKKENIDIHHYDVIYKAIEEMRAGMEGLLEPEEKEVFQGTVEVREVFRSSSGNIAGCAVTKGVVHRNDKARVKRGGEVIFEGGLSSLKRFKNDAKEVKEGFECGITVSGFDSYRRGDLIETYQIIKVARKLEG